MWTFLKQCKFVYLLVCFFKYRFRINRNSFNISARETDIDPIYVLINIRLLTSRSEVLLSESVKLWLMQNLTVFRCRKYSSTIRHSVQMPMAHYSNALKRVGEIHLKKNCSRRLVKIIYTNKNRKENKKRKERKKEKICRVHFP